MILKPKTITMTSLYMIMNMSIIITMSEYAFNYDYHTCNFHNDYAFEYDPEYIS